MLTCAFRAAQAFSGDMDSNFITGAGGSLDGAFLIAFSDCLTNQGR